MQLEHALHDFPPELRALTDDDGPFLDLATAHYAYEHGGADALRAQTREQVIRVAQRYAIQGNQGISKEESTLLSGAIGLDRDQEQSGFLLQPLYEYGWQTHWLGAYPQVSRVPYRGRAASPPDVGSQRV